MLVCLGSFVASKNVDIKYEKSEYHNQDDLNDGGYIMVDGYPTGEESIYYDDSDASSDPHYHYPEEDFVEQEYHIEYGQKHHPHSHYPADQRINQYEQHYVQEEREHNGRKLVKTDYDYERKSNHVVVENEKVPAVVESEHKAVMKKQNPPSKRVHIKLPEFDYSSYTKTDSEIKYDNSLNKQDKMHKEMKKSLKAGKHQYVEKESAPQSKYENIQRIPNDFSRGREVIRRRVRVRPDRPIQHHPYNEKLNTLSEVSVANKNGGKARRIPVRNVEGEGKDHVLYYVDQPVQVYDPQEKKFHQFDRISEKEVEELNKDAKEKSQIKEEQ